MEPGFQQRKESELSALPEKTDNFDNLDNRHAPGGRAE
jgi:hypothetical protein